jgi:hypothetical protein
MPTRIRARTRPTSGAGSGSLSKAPVAAGDPVADVQYGDNGVVILNVFYRDTQNNIQHVVWDTQSGLHIAEVWAGGNGTTSTGPAAAGKPAMMVWGNKELHLLYRSIAGGIWHVFSDSNGRHVESWAPESNPQAAAASAGDANFAQYCDYYHPPLPVCPPLGPTPGCVSTNSLGTHTWNYNSDGVAHYGMLFDFLQDVRTVPGGNELVDNNVMFGAEYLLRLKCRSRLSPSAECRPLTAVTAIRRYCRPLAWAPKPAAVHLQASCDCNYLASYLDCAFLTCSQLVAAQSTRPCIGRRRLFPSFVSSYSTRCGDVCQAGEARSARKTADSDFTVSPPMGTITALALCSDDPAASSAAYGRALVHPLSS